MALAWGFAKIEHGRGLGGYLGGVLVVVHLHGVGHVTLRLLLLLQDCRRLLLLLLQLHEKLLLVDGVLALRLLLLYDLLLQTVSVGRSADQARVSCYSYVSIADADAVGHSITATAAACPCVIC